MSFEGSHIETSSNWSGAYITANQDRQFLQIWGTWTIPDNLQIAACGRCSGPPDIPYVCANWIGLDGQRLYLNSSLPTDGDRIDTAAGWHDHGAVLDAMVGEWGREFRPGANWARGQSGQPGVVRADRLGPADRDRRHGQPERPARAIVAKGTSPTVTLPDGSMVQPRYCRLNRGVDHGAAARIVDGQTTIYNFPDYGETEFDFCVAVESDHVDIFSLFNGIPQQLQGARRIRMFQMLTDPARTTFISMPRKLNDTAIRVKYGGFA